MLPGSRPVHAALVAASLALSACGETPRVVVGVATNPEYELAARLAYEHARARGLAVAVDTALMPEATNLAVPAIEISQRLVARPGLVAVVGHSNSAASLAAARVYNTNRVIQISPTASATVYSDAGPFSFRLVPPDDRQGAFLADIVARQLPEDGRVAVLYVNDDYGRGLRGSFMEALRGSGVNVDLDLPFLENDLAAADVHQTVETLRRLQPDALVWLGRSSTLDRMIGAIRDAIGPVPIFGGDALGSAAQVLTVPEDWDGVHYVDFADLDATAAGRRFRAQYEARFGTPATVAAALTYDAMALVLEGIAAGARTGEELREYLTTLGRSRPPYAGVTGPAHFDADGDVDRSYQLTRVRPAGGPAVRP